MPASVTHLLDNLEARLSEAKAELSTLRDENQRLKRRLEAPAAHKPSAPPTDQPAPARATADGAEGRAEEGDEDANAGHVAQPAADAAPRQEAPSPQALLKQWYERYPQAFVTGHTRPLKVGIHADLARDEPWSNKLIRRALAHYVNLPRYIKALREGTPRVDLSGNPAGAVDKAAAQTAMEKRRRQEANAKRGAPRAGGRRAASSKEHAKKRPVTTSEPSAKREAPTSQPVPRSTSDAPAQYRTSQQDAKDRQTPEDMQSKLASLQRHFSRH